jgi:hypothetical protein
MMHHDGALPTSRRSADAAAIAIALQNSFTEPAEILLILPLERVARRAEAMREDLLIPAPAVHRSLNPLLQNNSLQNILRLIRAHP